MLSRGVRAGGYDLPGAESTAVPLIGYRPLSHDSSSLSDQPGRDGTNKVKPAQVSQRTLSQETSGGGLLLLGSSLFF